MSVNVPEPEAVDESSGAREKDPFRGFKRHFRTVEAQNLAILTALALIGLMQAASLAIQLLADAP